MTSVRQLRNWVRLGLAITVVAIASQANAQDATFKLYNADAKAPPGTTYDGTVDLKSDEVKMSVAGIADIMMSMSVDGEISTRILGEGKEVSVYRKMKSIITTDSGDGDKNTQDVPYSLIDEKMMAERSDGKWTYKLLKGEPTKEQQKDLDMLAKFATIQEMGAAATYKDKEYKIGDRIPIDTPMYGTFGLAQKDFEASGGVTVDRVEEFGGLRCAVLKGKYSEKGNMEPDEDITKGQAVISGDITIWRSIDHSIDMKVEFDGDFKQGIVATLGISMTGGGPIKISQTMSVREKE